MSNVPFKIKFLRRAEAREARRRDQLLGWLLAAGTRSVDARWFKAEWLRSHARSANIQRRIDNLS